MMNSNNQESSKASSSSSSSSVQLDGFAPAAGSGAGSSSSMSAPIMAMKSSSASVAAAAAAAGGGGGGAGLQSFATATTNSKAAAATTTASSAVAATQTNRTKKRGPQQGATSTTATATATNGRAAENYDYVEETVVRPLSDVGSNFEPITLPQIQLRLKNLLEQLPKDLPNVPPPNNNNNNNVDNTTNDSYYSTIKSFASTLQITIEEYNLLISLVSSATYKWGVDRSGASQQNLAVMSAELQQCQDVISNVVSARLSNVLCPAVDVLIGEVEVVRGERGRGSEDDKANNGRSKNREDGEMNDDGSGSAPNAKRIKLNDDRLALTNTSSSSSSNNNNSININNSTPHHSNHERRINHYTRPLVDPSYVHLCHCILARNAPLIRHAVATSIHTAHRVIGDYMKAMKKDTSHDAGKGGYY